MNNLAEALVTEERKPFEIDDMAKAEWAMKKITQYKKIIDKRTAEYTQMKVDTDAWLADQLGEARNEIAFFERSLRPFAMKELDGSKKKSFSLPSGKIGFRAASKKFYLGDEEVKNDNEKLIAFAKSSMPELVKVKESVDWAGIKKQLVDMNDGKVITKDGEIVQGMRVVVGEDSFYVDVK